MKNLTVKARFLILSILILGISVFLFVLYEVNESKDDLLAIMESESATLIESLADGIEITAITNIEIEDMLVKRLNTVAELTGHIRTHNINTSEYLKNIAEEFGVSYIAILSGDGSLILQTDSLFNEQSLAEEIWPVLYEEMADSLAWIEIGSIDSDISGHSIYIIARRSNELYILSGIFEDRLLEFRKQIGIGKKLKDIGRNPDIIYAVLQDEQGILSASENIDSISSIESDTFLMSALASGNSMKRIFDYYKRNEEGEKIFEIVKKLDIQDTEYLIRLGMSLEKIRNIHKSSMLRAILTGAGIFLTGVIIIIYLITRQKFTVLRHKHSRVSQSSDLILGSISDGVLAVNNDGLIRVCNPAAGDILGQAPDFLLNTYYEEIFPEDKFLINETKVKKQGILFEEISYKLKSGKQKIFGISTSLIYSIPDKSGKKEIELIIVIIRDLTERKKIAELMQRKDKLLAMGELAGGVAHEIRNPLNAINVIAQRFQYEFEPDEDKDEYMKLVKTVRSEVNRVNGIIRQFLDFARPAKLNMASTDLSGFLDETIAIVSSQAMEQNIQINKDYGQGIKVNIDREKMKQALINLLQNSMDAITDSGEIKIVSNILNNSCMIDIIDSGKGIPEDKISRIFNPYFTDKDTGTGLGLSIVHQIISEHEGEIRVESAPGKGTKMSIILPYGFDKSVGEDRQ